VADIDRLAVWAARYALGRSTYAVGDVCEVLTRRRRDLTPKTRAVIVDDITAAEAKHALGMEMDAVAWRALRDVLDGMGVVR
jgi:hypothetical protein